MSLLHNFAKNKRPLVCANGVASTNMGVCTSRILFGGYGVLDFIPCLAQAGALLSPLQSVGAGVHPLADAH